MSFVTFVMNPAKPAPFLVPQPQLANERKPIRPIPPIRQPDIQHPLCLRVFVWELRIA